jgi:hypothetical protein
LILGDRDRRIVGSLNGNERQLLPTGSPQRQPRRRARTDALGTCSTPQGAN